MRTPEERRVGNGYCEYHRQKGHTTNECIQLRQLIDKLVKEGRLDHLVKNIKEGKDKQKSGGKKDTPKDKTNTIYMVQSWQRKTMQKVSQKIAQILSSAPNSGLILTNLEGMEFTYALRFEFTAINNEAEYEALIAGLCIATRMGARNLEENVDSHLVANHVLGKYLAKEDNMVQYLDKTKSLIQGFDKFTIKQVPRSENKKADALSKIASTSFVHFSKQVLVEILKNKSISEMEISTVIEEQNPTDSNFETVSSIDAHFYNCGSSALDLFRQTTYYERFTRVHGICTQDHANTHYLSWPFYKWGIDITGPFPVAAGGLKFLIVAIDYFTKWIEAKAVATITEVVIPAKIEMPTIRTAEVNVATNDDERRIDLDLLEE
nr:reverse transcriptase domain-containing protein [Tanacetum cinerariifolium]